jgi:nucleoside phosphorylase
MGCGCGSGDSGTSRPPLVAVLSAFPAELAPHVERASITDIIVIEGHVFRVGVLDGVPVLLGLTGIGLANAAATTQALLERFDVTGIVVSAVAGSSRLRIGDVAVPASWMAGDGTSYAADPQWLALAADIARAGTVSRERCTMVPTASEEPVCMAQEPAVVVGGVGVSTDPFGGKPFLCRPGGGDLFGCDVEPARAVAVRRGAVLERRASGAGETPAVEDMETAAIAREAAARGVPFIAFRAVSDGPGDPLGLPGFLAQFSAYYHLAARNAAAATAVFLHRVAATRLAKALYLSAAPLR